MKAASINEIKKELAFKDFNDVQALCMRLARYKKENKELLTYLLFEAHDEPGYIANVKLEIDTHFDALPPNNVYIIKKSLRKILRIVNKQIKYAGIPQTEVELRIYYCSCIKEKKIPLRSSQVLTNLYAQQLRKIDAAMAKLPEDLQYDYTQAIKELKQG